MKNLFIFLMLAYAASSSSFYYGQTKLADENGLILTYKIGAEKIGSRYDEYCKTTFDIYQVEGIVENTNTDKAAMVTAILSFEGQACNKIYSNDNNTTGEVVDKLFNLDIWGQSGKQSQYWVNRYVHLTPGDHMTAKGHVEVKQNEKVHEPDKYFTYELIPSQKTTLEDNNENLTMGNNISKSNNTPTKDTYSELIIGEWDVTRKLDVYTDGRQEERGELFQTYIFKPNGIGEYQGNGEGYDFKWHFLDNKIVYIYEDPELNETIEIQKLDKSTLVLKSNYTKNSMGLDFWLYTFKRVVK